MRNYIIMLLTTLLKRLLPMGYYSLKDINVIEDLMKTRIFNHLPTGVRLNLLTLVDSAPHKLHFTAQFINGDLSFNIELQKQTIFVEFVSTTINDMYALTEILEKIMPAIRNNEYAIGQSFIAILSMKGLHGK